MAAAAILRAVVPAAVVVDDLAGAALVVVGVMIGRVVRGIGPRCLATLIVVGVVVGRVVRPVAEHVDLGVAAAIAVRPILHRGAHVRQRDAAFEGLEQRAVA